MTSMIPRHRLLFPLLLIGVAALTLIYFFVDPMGEGGAYLPKCSMKALTGWECPGCGFQRAIHALLNGHFTEAWWCNPFLWLVMPYLALLIVSRWRGWDSLYYALTSPAAGVIYLVCYFGWWILRNIMTL